MSERLLNGALLESCCYANRKRVGYFDISDICFPVLYIKLWEYCHLCCELLNFPRIRNLIRIKISEFCFRIRWVIMIHKFCFHVTSSPPCWSLTNRCWWTLRGHMGSSPIGDSMTCFLYSMITTGWTFIFHKRFLLSFFCLYHQHGLCHFGLLGLVVNHLF